jgi:hypothetical protein
VKWLAEWLRRFADRIDYDGAPKCTEMTFTFESGVGIVVHKGDSPRPGCKLWTIGGEAEYEKAHTEAANPGLWVDWKTMQVKGARSE